MRTPHLESAWHGSDYKLKLELFEGSAPSSALPYQRDEIDIYDISLELITRQTPDILDAFKQLNIELAGQFVVMAANSIYLKSRSLLPVDQ